MGAIYQGRSNRSIRAENDFSGGINNEQEASFVADNEFTEGYGFDFDHFPDLTVRKGKQNYGASGSGATNLLTNFKESHLVRAVGTSLQYNSSGTTWSAISGSFANVPWDATNFEVSGADALILTNGTDAVKYWNGSALADLSANAPKGKYITADPSRVFIAKDDELHWCAFQDATDWTTGENSGMAQYYTYGGGDITALFNFKDIKYIWKKDAMAGLYGTSYYDFRIMEVSNNIGCVDFKTVQEVNGILIWLGQQDIYAFTQGNPYPIGGKVRGFLNRINWSQISKCCAFTDGIRYYLNLVIDNATEPNIRLVYDTRYGRWRVAALNEGLRRGLFFNNELYAGDSSGQTMKVNIGTTDNGTPIPWSVTSKAFDEGIGEAEKEYKEIHFQGEFGNTASMTVSLSTEERGNNFTPLDYDPLSSPARAQNKNLIVPLDTTDLTHWMRYRIEGTGPVSFYKLQRYYRVCRVQR